ncbi:FAD-binding protein [Amorphus sp. 3PC139-8]|uniref:FAD-binding protein n=1 Tax=Amorphus sp. 3PC139-8 TaxID=2735676 RepID=UPI00345DB47B
MAGPAFQQEDPTRPATAEEVRSVVAWAVGEERPLEIVGSGAKRAIGPPVTARHVVELSRLSGITLYEPEELVLSALAGTPLAEIEATLADAGQELAFEPIDYGPLLGAAAGGGTLGGLVATNLSGPRRIKAGAARDHVLGVEAVSGRGEAFKSGGRVVKNVTGYDLGRGLSGSWGTLAVFTALSLKVLSRSETGATLVLPGLDDARAIRALAAALGSSADVSGAAHLPAGLAQQIAPLAGADGSLTLVRVEGFAPSVKARIEALSALLKDVAPVEVIEGDASVAIWRAVRDVRPFWTTPEQAVWRVSVTPSEGPAVVSAVAGGGDIRAFYDWGGGLIWIEHPSEGDAGASTIRQAIAANGGGHATLIRAPVALRSDVLVFQPEADGLQALTRRIKAQFDPTGILNPGRMGAGR